MTVSPPYFTPEIVVPRDLFETIHEKIINRDKVFAVYITPASHKKFIRECFILDQKLLRGSVASVETMNDTTLWSWSKQSTVKICDGSCTNKPIEIECTGIYNTEDNILSIMILKRPQIIDLLF